MTWPGKILLKAGFEPGSSALETDALTTRPTRRLQNWESSLKNNTKDHLVVFPSLSHTDREIKVKTEHVTKYARKYSKSMCSIPQHQRMQNTMHPCACTLFLFSVTHMHQNAYRYVENNCWISFQFLASAQDGIILLRKVHMCSIPSLSRPSMAVREQDKCWSGWTQVNPDLSGLTAASVLSPILFPLSEGN